jgi:glucose/arabinose dehydrogenase
LDLALDPDFAANNTIYLSYLQGDEMASTIRVLRAKLDEPNETLTEQQTMFESSPGTKPEQLGGRRIGETTEGRQIIAKTSRLT